MLVNNITQFLLSVISFSASNPVIQINCTIDDVARMENFRSNSEAKWLRTRFTDLTLQNCSLPSLPSDSFDSWNFAVLNISQSEVSTIGSNAFGALSRLEKLILTGNNFTHIQSWSERDLMRLHSLDLRQNGISEVAINAFCRYPNLEVAILANNTIERLMEGTFKCVPALRMLNLANNHLKIIESFTFNGLSQLVELSLAQNHIEYVNPFAFAPLHELRHLELHENRLKELSAETFNALPHLVYLNISHNAIATILDETFHANEEIQVLDMSFNSISTLAVESLHGLRQLVSFNCSNNDLKKFDPELILVLPRLEQLVLASNKLNHLHERHFGDASFLKVIDLSNNSIAMVHRHAFDSMKNLKSLDLTDNHISNDAFLGDLSSIKSLKLNQNNFTALNLSLLRDIGDVELIGNYWQCSWLIPELIRNRIPRGVKFVREDSHLKQQYTAMEEIDCYDYSRSNATNKHLILRHVIVLHAESNDDDDDEQRFEAINTYPRTFNKLLKEEFDYKACLLWIAVGVFMVVGLIRLGKYVFDKTERRNGAPQQHLQDRPRAEIDSCLIRPSSENKSRA